MGEKLDEKILKRKEEKKSVTFEEEKALKGREREKERMRERMRE